MHFPKQSKSQSLESTVQRRSTTIEETTVRDVLLNWQLRFVDTIGFIFKTQCKKFLNKNCNFT